MFIKLYPLLLNLRVSKEIYLNFCNEFSQHVCFKVFPTLSCCTLCLQEGPKKILLITLTVKIPSLKSKPTGIFELLCVCACKGSCL